MIRGINMTQYSWIFLVLFYGVSKGARDAMKKLAMQKSSMMEVLFFHSLFAFIFTIPTVNNVFDIPGIYYLLIFIKSLIVFSAWILSFRSLSKMPVSSYGLIDVSGVVFSTLIGVLVLGESLNFYNTCGLLFVVLGLYLVNIKSSDSSEKETDIRYVFLAIAACLLNAISGTLDKIYTNYVTPGQLQFWFMLFMVVLYILYLIVSNTKVSIRSVSKNYWIIILSVLFVIADRTLFIANSNPHSKVSVMILLKQSCVPVSILLGKFVFGEKRIMYKLLCGCIIIAGIMLAIL